MDKLLNITQASEMLGVSADTLRRWEEKGKIKSIRIKRGKYEYRYYSEDEVSRLLIDKDIYKTAKDWAVSTEPDTPLSLYYCPNVSVFNARLTKLETVLINNSRLSPVSSLLVLIAGEIGNNSFDHNLGNWPDVPGVFFAYNIDRKIIVLADRGQGILKTLCRAKPDLASHEQALETAFTEFISGRIPERRGNGLKLVKRIILKNNFQLFFQTGNAFFNLKRNGAGLDIKTGNEYCPGCLAKIEF
jgi:excisionase family DNA binding protein